MASDPFDRSRSRNRDAPDVTPALRVMLVEFRRARITEANAIADLLGLEVVCTEAAWRERQADAATERRRMRTRGEGKP